MWNLRFVESNENRTILHPQTVFAHELICSWKIWLVWNEWCSSEIYESRTSNRKFLWKAKQSSDHIPQEPKHFMNGRCKRWAERSFNGIVSCVQIIVSTWVQDIITILRLQLHNRDYRVRRQPYLQPLISTKALLANKRRTRGRERESTLDRMIINNNN